MSLYYAKIVTESDRSVNECRLNKMDVFCVNEFEVGVNDSLFPGNEQQVYCNLIYIYRNHAILSSHIFLWTYIILHMTWLIYNTRFMILAAFWSAMFNPGQYLFSYKEMDTDCHIFLKSVDTWIRTSGSLWGRKIKIKF